MSSFKSVSCATGFIDRTPIFMERRNEILNKINSVYVKHCVEKIETPVFELKELFSNKKFFSNKVIELDDQGGTILALRSDLKIPLVRYLASRKMESNFRYTQSGYIYTKENVDLSKFKVREKFVSDFDIGGPCDPMLTEIQCIRMLCDVMSSLNFDEEYKINIGHRKLFECLLKLNANIPESQATKFATKLADNNVNSKVDWVNALKTLNNSKLSLEIMNKMQEVVKKYSGSFYSCIDAIIGDAELSQLKEMKNVLTDLSKLKQYCQFFLKPDDIKRLYFDADIVGCHSYYTGLLFNISVDDNFICASGGKYENLVNRFISNYKEQMSLSGFTIAVDDITVRDLRKKGMFSFENCTSENGTTDVVKMMNNTKIQNKSNSIGDNKIPPKGTIDRTPAQMRAREYIFETITECFKRYRASQIDTPVVERKDILTEKYGEDSKLIYDLDDIDGESFSLRYDLTVPFARYLVMHPEVIEGDNLFKRYQIGRVYRRDNPSISTGRYREFYQCDFDIAGKVDELMKPDSECLSIVYEVLRDLNLGEYKIKVNHRKLLDGLFAVCGVPENLFKTICSSVDKLDKTPWVTVKEEMIGKGITDATADKIGEYVALNGGLDLIDRLECDVTLMGNENARLALSELRVLLNLCSDKLDRISFDLSLARGLDYYTGMIFEAVITEKITKAKGDLNENEERVGSVSGGGRYDNLVNMFSEDPNNQIPCVGLSLGVERLMAIYQRKQEQEEQLNLTEDGTVDNRNKKKKHQVMVISTSDKKFPIENPECERMKVLSMLLEAGISSLHPMKRHTRILDIFQICENEGIPLQVVFGYDEVNDRKVQIRRTFDRQVDFVPIGELVEKLKDALI